MPPELDCHLRDAALETFEALAFMFPMPEELAGPPAAGEETVSAVIRFHGPLEGAVHLRVSQAMLPPLAGNMLGLDAPDVDASQQGDALAELLNVICGNVLPRAFGAEAVFNVRHAEMLPDAALPPELQECPCAASVKLVLDEGAVAISLYVLTDVSSPQAVPAGRAQ